MGKKWRVLAPNDEDEFPTFFVKTLRFGTKFLRLILCQYVYEGRKFVIEGKGFLEDMSRRKKGLVGIENPHR